MPSSDPERVLVIDVETVPDASGHGSAAYFTMNGNRGDVLGSKSAHPPRVVFHIPESAHTLRFTAAATKQLMEGNQDVAFLPAGMDTENLSVVSSWVLPKTAGTAIFEMDAATKASLLKNPGAVSLQRDAFVNYGANYGGGRYIEGSEHPVLSLSQHGSVEDSFFSPTVSRAPQVHLPANLQTLTIGNATVSMDFMIQSSEQRLQEALSLEAERGHAEAPAASVRSPRR